MTMSTKEIARTILDDSYSILSDLSKISKAVANSASSIGIVLPRIPSIEFGEEEGAKEAAPAETGGVTQRKGILGGMMGRRTETANKAPKPKMTPLAKKVIIPVIPKTGTTLAAGEQKTGGGAVKPAHPALMPFGTAAGTKVKAEAPQTGAITVEGKTEGAAVKPHEMLQPATSTKTTPAMVATKPHLEEKSEVEKAPGAIPTPTDNPISKLLTLVKARDSITLADASKEMNAPRELVEQWAKILSQNLLIKLKYQLVGDVILEA